MEFVFTPPTQTAVPVAGTQACFPVRRIFCVGRNYADHAREMGALAQATGEEPPFFFMKPADALVTGEGELLIRYPSLTANLHHEVEMVVALKAGGENVTVDDALALVFGYGVGVDLTRRDLQAKAKEKGHPWDMSKGFDDSAVLGTLHTVAEVGHPRAGKISLVVNDQIRQAGDLSQMGWGVAEIIANLSRFVCLAPGDLIYTGTPAGVGPLLRGDCLRGEVEGIGGFLAKVI